MRPQWLFFGLKCCNKNMWITESISSYVEIAVCKMEIKNKGDEFFASGQFNADLRRADDDLHRLDDDIGCGHRTSSLHSINSADRYIMNIYG